MKSIIYNLNSIRPPLTGIGRYAIELLRTGVEANMPLMAIHGNKVLESDSLAELLKEYDQPTSQSGQLGLSERRLRQLIGGIPFSRALYRSLDRLRFNKLTKTKIAEGAIIHDLNYSLSPLVNSGLSTVYDLSHVKYQQTHPRHRVKYLEQYFNELKLSDTSIITISDSVRLDLIDNYDIHPSRIQVTHLAADSVFRPRDETGCQARLDQYALRFKHYILCVGTLEPRKNLGNVLTAYESLDETVKNAFPLVIAGASGWKSRKLEEQLTRLSKTGTVIKLGFVPQGVLPVLYAGAAAFVYPSLYEGFGLPLLEAMQSGCPCITSNTGALAEVSGDHAIQVNPERWSDIASNLNQLLQDSEQISYYSQSGQQRAKDFSWRKTAANTRKIYDAL